MIAWLKERTAKEWLAFIAMFGSLLGAAVLTANRVWLIQILERAQQWSAIADLARLDTLIIGVVLISLGLAINRRTAKLGKDGLEISGGE